MEIFNKTPFISGLDAVLDKDGSEVRVAILKATYEIGTDGVVSIADAQEPIAFEDEYYGAPAISSVIYEADGAYFKPGTDIIAIGCAHSPFGRPSREFDASLSVAHLSKTIRVFGDRSWVYSSVFGISHTDPKPITEVQLRWEKAFGGADTLDRDPTKHVWEKRNPLGTGFRVRSTAESLDGVPLPNFEDPANLIDNWNDKPTPQGFGFVGRSWMPRIAYAGTFDSLWQKTRMPIPPIDFDYRFFNGAPSGLVLPGFLQGGETVTAVNLSKLGVERFVIPAVRVTFRGRARKRPIERTGALDTVVLKLEERKMVLVWRAKYQVSLNDPADAIEAEVAFLS